LGTYPGLNAEYNSSGMPTGRLGVNLNKREARGADITMESETFVVLTDAPDSCRHRYLPSPRLPTSGKGSSAITADI
jgi:hypothetical protein